jgi:hypothetical protein
MLTVLAICGFGISILFAGLEAFHHSIVWGMVQLPGFLLGESIWGLDNGENGFEIVMVIANGLVYGVLLLSAWFAGRALKARR